MVKQITAIIVLLGLCAQFALGRWAVPIEITTYDDPVRINKALYTDSASGYSHVAYCNSSDGALYYARLDDSGLFLEGPTALDTVRRCFQVSIVGPKDGQHLYLVMEARRTMETEECSEENKGSCDDIFVFASNDAGTSFSPVDSIGGNPGDVARRRALKILENWASDFFWIVYTWMEPYKVGTKLVRYNYKKNKFSSEKVVHDKLNKMAIYNLNTISEKGDHTLLSIYSTPFSLVMKSKVSKDDGNTWKNGVDLKGMCAGDGFVLKNIISHGKYLIAGCMKRERLHFSYSTDLGETWTEPLLFPITNLEDITYCSHESPNSPINMLTLFFDKRNLNISISDLPNNPDRFLDVPEAFYFGSKKLDLNCYYKGDELKLRLMYHVRTTLENGSRYTLYIIDNDNGLESLAPIEEKKTDL